MKNPLQDNQIISDNVTEEMILETHARLQKLLLSEGKWTDSVLVSREDLRILLIAYGDAADARDRYKSDYDSLFALHYEF